MPLPPKTRCRKRWWPRWPMPGSSPAAPRSRPGSSASCKNKIVDVIRQQSRSHQRRPLSPDEDSLDQTFDTLFKDQCALDARLAPARLGQPGSRTAPAALLGRVRSLPQPPAREHGARLHDARVPRFRNARGLPGTGHHGEQLQRHPAPRAQCAAPVPGARLVHRWRSRHAELQASHPPAVRGPGPQARRWANDCRCACISSCAWVAATTASSR